MTKPNSHSQYDRKTRPKTGYAGELRSRRRPNNAPSLATPARLFAYKLIEMVQNENISVHEASRRFLGQAKLSPEDKSFSLLLSTGVVSTYGSLNQAINQVLSKPSDCDQKVRNALCVSSYEILYLGKAAHAAVDQGVELVRAVAPRATKLANFVLRRIVDLRKGLPRLGEGTLEDDALITGFPLWIVKELTQTRGANWTHSFLAQAGEQTLAKEAAPIWFAFNENRVNASQALEKLVERGVSAAPERSIIKTQPIAFRLKNRKSVSDALFSGLLKEGGLVVSDFSAQSIVALSFPENALPKRFLEIGAGRGTKTIMLQNFAKHAYGKQMDLCSVEVNEHKAKILADRCKRAKVNTDVVKLDATDLSSLEGAFDAILLDAPCSGSGTMRRHPEIKWRITPYDIDAIAKLELTLLIEAARKLAPGGLLTYATCSVFKQENEDVVDAFLSSEEGKSFELQPMAEGVNYFFTKPSVNGPDVHFAAQLRRVK